MSRSFVLVGLLIAALAAFMRSGAELRKFVFVFGFLSFCIGFVWFLSRNRSVAPSAAESVVAFWWLWLRRAISFAGAALFGTGAVWFLIYGNPFREGDAMGWLESAFVSLLFLALSALCVWVGIFGQGSDRNALSDDVELHQKNKRRYKWRW